MKKKEEKSVIKPKKNFRKFFIFFLLLYIFISIFINVIKMPIKHISIQGNNLVTDDQIITVAKIKKYPPIFLLNTAKIEKDLLKNKLIKEVNIKKNWSGKLTIKITENKLLFYKKENQKVIISGGEEVDIDFYNGIPMLINYVPNIVYPEFVNKFSNLDSSIIALMNYIEYSPSKNEAGETIDEQRFLIQMNDDNKVYTNPEKLENLNFYLDLLSSLEGKKGILNLDAGNYFRPYEGQ